MLTELGWSEREVMPREYRPITFYNPGGNAQDTDRDFSPAQERIEEVAPEPGNYTADQMVSGVDTSDLAEVSNPKELSVVEPVELKEPLKVSKDALAKPPAK